MTWGKFLFRNNVRLREKTQSMHDFLVVARLGLKKTKIMYAANLSWTSMEKLIVEAEASELIEEIEAPRHQQYWTGKPTMVWKTTQKGLKYAKVIYDNWKQLKEIGNDG